MDSSCKVHFGDNLAYMKTLADGSIDFIYVDPPFFSAADYYTRKGSKAFYIAWHNAAVLRKQLTRRRNYILCLIVIKTRGTYILFQFLKVCPCKIFK